MYRLTIRKSALKILRRMPDREARRFREALEGLARDPGRRDLDVARLRGRPEFRLRVGAWRAIFERDDDLRRIDVARIGPRGDVYRA